MVNSGQMTARQVSLRYLGFAPKPLIVPGWQVQFVFDLGGRGLRAVYTEEVPLEWKREITGEKSECSRTPGSKRVRERARRGFQITDYRMQTGLAPDSEICVICG
jgi:hypothetical protein